MFALRSRFFTICSSKPVRLNYSLDSWSCLFFHVCPSTVYSCAAPGNLLQIHFRSQIKNIHWQIVKPECLKKEMFNDLGKLNFEKTKTKAALVPAPSLSSPRCRLSFAKWIGAHMQCNFTAGHRWRGEMIQTALSRNKATWARPSQTSRREQRNWRENKKKGFSKAIWRLSNPFAQRHKDSLQHTEIKIDMGGMTSRFRVGPWNRRWPFFSLQNKIPSLDLHKIWEMNIPVHQSSLVDAQLYTSK